MAFPSISTGIFGYPLEDAAGVALGAVRKKLAAASSVTLVRFVLWDQASYAGYERAAVRLGLAPNVAPALQAQLARPRQMFLERGFTFTHEAVRE